MRVVLTAATSPGRSKPGPVVQVNENYSPGQTQRGPITYVPNFSRDPVGNLPQVPSGKNYPTVSVQI